MATYGQATVREGMDVVGADGDRVGTVKEVRGSDFLAERTMQRDIYVPFDAIRDVSGEVITLRVTAGDADNMGWPSSPITGSVGGVGGVS